MGSVDLLCSGVFNFMRKKALDECMELIHFEVSFLFNSKS